MLYGFESHRLRHKGNPLKWLKTAISAGFLRFLSNFQKIAKGKNRDNIGYEMQMEMQMEFANSQLWFQQLGIECF